MTIKNLKNANNILKILIKNFYAKQSIFLLIKKNLRIYNKAIISNKF